MTTIRIDELASLVTAAWRKHVPQEDAERISRGVVACALQKDGRMDAIADTLSDLSLIAERGLLPPKIVRDQGPCVVIDFNGAPGMARLPEIERIATNRARQYGVAILGLRNSGGVHELCSWVEELPRSDLLTIFCWNGGSYTTVPHGSRQPFFGTNPIGYGIPCGGRPLVVDMATAHFPYVTLSHALKTNTPFKETAGLDADGRYTTLPSEIYNPSRNDEVRLIPMGGGYKGTALMLLLEILTGALVGAKMSREATDDPWIPEEFGGLLIAIDCSAFTSTDSFLSSVTTMVEQIRNSIPAEGFESVSLPGDRSVARELKARELGWIDIPDQAATALRQFGT